MKPGCTAAGVRSKLNCELKGRAAAPSTETEMPAPDDCRGAVRPGARAAKRAGKAAGPRVDNRRRMPTAPARWATATATEGGATTSYRVAEEENCSAQATKPVHSTSGQRARRPGLAGHGCGSGQGWRGAAAAMQLKRGSWRWRMVPTPGTHRRTRTTGSTSAELLRVPSLTGVRGLGRLNHRS